MRNDLRCGFEIVRARDIDRVGTQGVIEKLRERVAGTKVYISVDIDVLDPAFAPGQYSVNIVAGYSADLFLQRLVLPKLEVGVLGSF